MKSILSESLHVLQAVQEKYCSKSLSDRIFKKREKCLENRLDVRPRDKLLTNNKDVG